MKRASDHHQVVRVDDAIRCCEKNAVRLLGNLQSALNDVLAQAPAVSRGGALAFAPAPGGAYVITRLTPAQYAAWIRGISVVKGTLVVGSIVLLSYAELAPLIAQKAFYETMALVGNIVGILQRPFVEDRQDDNFCEECNRSKALGQKARRHRETVKILRRL